MAMELRQIRNMREYIMLYGLFHHILAMDFVMRFNTMFANSLLIERCSLED